MHDVTMGKWNGTPGKMGLGPGLGSGTILRWAGPGLDWGPSFKLKFKHHINDFAGFARDF